MVILLGDGGVFVVVVEPTKYGWLPVQDDHRSSLARNTHAATPGPPIQLWLLVTGYWCGYNICIALGNTRWW